MERVSSDPTESENIREICEIWWARTESSFELFLGVPDEGSTETALASRQIDASQTSGHRGYIQAHRLITFAFEHHVAYRSLVGAIGYSISAPLTLLRPVLEASLWSIWLLDPDDSADRRYRGLLFEILDRKQQIVYFDELGRTSDGEIYRDIAKSLKSDDLTCRNEAAEQGHSFENMYRQSVYLTREIPKLAALEKSVGSDVVHILTAEWRRLSGLTHGKAWAPMQSADSYEAAKVPGGSAVKLSPSDASITLATHAVYGCFNTAMDLYRFRCMGGVQQSTT